MNKKISSVERYVNYTLYIVMFILAIVVIASVFDTLIRYIPDAEIMFEVYGGLLTFGSILAVISIILIVNFILVTYKFASLNRKKNLLQALQ